MTGAWTVERHARLASTSDRAKALARGGAPSRFVVVAREQAAGRGRGDHVWTSPVGGLYASVLLRDVPERVTPLLALVGALALREATAACFPDLGLWVKWPNDLLAGPPRADRPHGKAGGVLVETGGAGGRVAWVVMGFGANVAMDPARLPPVDPPAVSLRALSGRDAAPEQLLPGLLDALDAVLATYGEDPARLVAAVDAVLAYRGDEVQVMPRDEGLPIAGRLLGLAEDGALRLAVADGRRSVASWDVASLRPLG